MRLRSFILSCPILLGLPGYAAEKNGIEASLIKTATDADYAVLSMIYWGQDGQRPDPQHWGVVGSSFLINTHGYFVTAAHVLDLYKPNSAQLTVTLRQGDALGESGMWFDVVEKDEAHDLALCQIKNFRVNRPDRKDHKPTIFPISTLEVSSETLQQGQFIAIAGFPLGSLNSAVQFGTIAATQTWNPNIAGVSAGRRDLVQVSASGNRGNSGGPVISLRTGKVVGVVVQAVPAPLWSNQPVAAAQNSGIMLAVPAQWVRELLERHQVKSEEHKPKEALGIGF